MAVQFFPCPGLVGGIDTLDAIVSTDAWRDTENNPVALATGDIAITVMTDAEYRHKYDADSIAAHNPPSVIIPTDIIHPAPGRWIRVAISGGASTAADLTVDTASFTGDLAGVDPNQQAVNERWDITGSLSILRDIPPDKINAVIAGSCDDDLSAYITSVVADLAPGRTLNFDKGVIRCCDVTIANLDNLTIRGGGIFKPILSSTTSINILSFSTCDSLSIDGITFDGDHVYNTALDRGDTPTLRTTALLYIYASDSADVHKCNFRNYKMSYGSIHFNTCSNSGLDSCSIKDYKVTDQAHFIRDYSYTPAGVLADNLVIEITGPNLAAWWHHPVITLTVTAANTVSIAISDTSAAVSFATTATISTVATRIILEGGNSVWVSWSSNDAHDVGDVWEWTWWGFRGKGVGFGANGDLTTEVMTGNYVRNCPSISGIGADPVSTFNQRDFICTDNTMVDVGAWGGTHCRNVLFSGNRCKNFSENVIDCSIDGLVFTDNICLNIYGMIVWNFLLPNDALMPNNNDIIIANNIIKNWGCHTEDGMFAGMNGAIVMRLGDTYGSYNRVRIENNIFTNETGDKDPANYAVAIVGGASGTSVITDLVAQNNTINGTLLGDYDAYITEVNNASMTSTDTTGGGIISAINTYVNRPAGGDASITGTQEFLRKLDDFDSTGLFTAKRLGLSIEGAGTISQYGNTGITLYSAILNEDAIISGGVGSARIYPAIITAGDVNYASGLAIWGSTLPSATAYSASTDYIVGDKVSSAKVIYICIQPNGPGSVVKDVSDTLYWKIYARLTTQHGLVIKALNAATDGNFGIYSDDSATPSWHSGDVLVGGTDTAPNLTLGSDGTGTVKALALESASGSNPTLGLSYSETTYGLDITFFNQYDVTGSASIDVGLWVDVCGPYDLNGAAYHYHSQYSLTSHTHTQSQSHGSPDTDTATTALHHTLGTGANQAAAGNHTHAFSQYGSQGFLSANVDKTSTESSEYVIPFDTVTNSGGSLNSDTCLDITTNKGRYTPLTSGLYEVSGMVGVRDLGSAVGTFLLQFKVSGSGVVGLIGCGEIISAGGDCSIVIPPTLINIYDTQYIDLRINRNADVDYRILQYRTNIKIIKKH